MSKDWLEAIKETKLDIKSARDGLATKGWLDTGNYALNWAISGRLQRGYPLGHTVEIFGDTGTGKSFLVARALASVQAAGGVALLDDTEGAYSPEHIAALGVDIDRLGYRNSRTVKDHLSTAQSFVTAYKNVFPKHDKPGLLACDSLALLSTEHELSTRLEKRDMSKAAELRAFFRIIGTDLSQLPLLHISTNHTIANIGDIFNNRTTPGGGGPKFQASVRIDLRGISRIKLGTEFVGVICRAFVEKNRVIAPWKETRLAIPFHQQISRASGLIPLLLRLGILQEQGAFLAYQGKRLGLRTYKSKDAFLKQDEAAEALLDQEPDILDETDAFLETHTPTLTGAADEDALDAETTAD